MKQLRSARRLRLGFVNILNLENFIGWKLDEAKAVLARDETPRAGTLRLIETAAPLRKNGAPIFGEWRVLFARFDENENIEFTVARELLDENRAPARPAD